MPIPPLPHQPGTQSPARQAFSLLPFGAGADSLAGIAIEGWLERQGEALTLEFQLRGAAEQGENAILWPAAGGQPQRRDGLWEHTCLEWFLAHPHQEAYWEFNLCPNGDWNVYALDGYRRGLRPDPHYNALPLERSGNGSGNGRISRFRATATLPAALLPAEQASAQPAELELAVTAVLEQRSGVISYWALHHGGTEADFHRRDGFRLRI
jgi:hypothetical protein